jgi:hypothetical protein
MLGQRLAKSGKAGLDAGKADLQLIANEENQIAPSVEKMRPAGWYRSFEGRENIWVTAPPMIDPMMPSTIVHKIVMCTRITDFAISPATNPTTMYQIKWNMIFPSIVWPQKVAEYGQAFPN